MPTRERAVKYFVGCVAMFLIDVCVMNSKEPPQYSNWFAEFSKRRFYLENVRHKREAVDTIINSTTSAPSTKKSISSTMTLNTTKVTTSATSIMKLASSVTSSTTSTTYSTTSTSRPLTKYLIEIEIATADAKTLHQLSNALKTIHLPLNNSYSIITEMNITTVCLLTGTDYQCKCEDQYSWPYLKCTKYGYCDDIINGTCRCISALPDDGQFCQPISDVIRPQTDYLMEVEMATIGAAELNLLKNTLQTLSLPLISINSIIIELNITTVCSLNGTEYKCRCEEQYLWPCEMCSVFGSCNSNADVLCGCINAIPTDGQFCQPIRQLTNTSACTNKTETHVLTFSLTINEMFNLELINISSEKYQTYKKIIENSINRSYNTISAYTTNSTTVTGFRPGSVSTDFAISATTDNLNLVSANQQVIASLRELGFDISDDAFSRTVKDGLYKSTVQIYPENDLTLICTTTNHSITWKKNKNILTESEKYKMNSASLIVKNITSDDTGIYECTTSENLMPYIIWQRFMIPDPNIQVNSSKLLTCGNQKVILQCCVQHSYSVALFTEPEGICNITDQRNGCIYCSYNINENECHNKDMNVTVTCKLTNSIHAKRFNIDAVNKVFECNDSTFGAGYMENIKEGYCYGDMIGYRIARCEAGQWKEMVENNTCVTREIKYLKDISQDIIVTDLVEFAKNVSRAAVEKASEITKSPATILTIVELLITIAELSQTVIIHEQTMGDFLQTLDVIGSTDAKSTWLYLNHNPATLTKSSEILESTEKIASRLQNESFNISTNENFLQKYHNISTPFTRTVGKYSTEISITTISTLKSIIVIISLSFNNILPFRNLTHNDSGQNAVTTINGDVALIQTDPKINNILLSFNVRNKTLSNPQCVFWNFSLLNDVGGWDSSGCRLKPLLRDNSERYKCECNHTTSFSILMSPFPPKNCDASNIMTYVGVGISMASLVLCLIIECFIWKSVKRGYASYLRHVAIVNIAVSLLIANICFIIGAAVIKHNPSCIAATFFMHFFYLAVFFWMLLSALFLLYCVNTIVYNISKRSMMGIAFSVGYGAPLIIAVITVASTARHGYIQQDHNCWLNWNETKALLAFVIPALTIVAINIMVLIVVLCKMLRRQVGEVGACIPPEEKHPLLIIAKCVGILTPLFGLTWGLGIGTMLLPECAVHVAFAFFNSLQGFFILLFGTLLDRKVRQALAEKIGLTSLSSSVPTGSTNAASSSSGGFPLFQRLRKRNAYNISEGRLVSSPSSN